MRRRPFRQFDRMLDELADRFDEEPFDGGDEATTAAVDVAETDDEFVVVVDLPGFDSSDIDLRVTDRTVHISAEHTAEREPDADTYHLRERAYRSVSRSIQLPGDVDTDEVSAAYEDGVLTVTLPQAAPEDARGHRVQIE
ncbi:Hsp20/alpha crystallin family protein [Haloplanus sp. C73]|uniref:Hsp20/alpha crystallin family protein n=1 Tax=Haloplanus sp. C73 TaxID=3421641 RepID=UPI003EB8A9FC